MKTAKRKLFEACMNQPVKWLEASADAHNPNHRPIHKAIIRLAIRKKGGRTR